MVFSNFFRKGEAVRSALLVTTSNQLIHVSKLQHYSYKEDQIDKNVSI